MIIPFLPGVLQLQVSWYKFLGELELELCHAAFNHWVFQKSLDFGTVPVVGELDF
jgi:hypothetical protein